MTSKPDNVKSGLEQSCAYWDQRAAHSSTDCERVEQSRRAQRMRFEAFLIAHDLQGRSVLDVGCGVGDFWEHLKRRGIACDYVGFDLAPEMIRRCLERFPGVPFKTGNLLEWDPGRSFDYVVAFGVHGIKVAGGRAVLESVTRRQFELSAMAAHTTLLTDRYAGFAPHIQAWNPEEALTLALQITPYVLLQHDYLPNSFSLTLYREPLIDTRKGLLLD